MRLVRALGQRAAVRLARELARARVTASSGIDASRWRRGARLACGDDDRLGVSRGRSARADIGIDAQHASARPPLGARPEWVDRSHGGVFAGRIHTTRREQQAQHQSPHGFEGSDA